MTDDSGRSKKLAVAAFDASLAPTTLANETDGTIEALISAFEAASHVDDEGNQYWLARDLQTLFEYAKWDNFLAVIDKARGACRQAGRQVEHHFADVGKMVILGSGAERDIGDIALSRYAAYLTAQNADGRKRPVAFAQTYYAIQTRRQEIADQETQEYLPFSENERRILLREEIKTHNKHLASAAKNAGVVTGVDFAIFQTEGYKGLYGGLDVSGIRRRKGLGSGQAILDHMGSTELAANLFRATQTEEKLRREGVKGKSAANRAHFEVGAKVRETIKELGGQMPENLPAAEDVKKVARQIQSAIKGTSKAVE